MPDSGKPKSAPVKTLEFPANRIAPPSKVAENSLLCQMLSSPVEVSFFAPGPSLACSWRSARSLWEQNQGADAIAALEGIAQLSLANAAISVPTLFLAAQVFFAAGDVVHGEQCVQRGLKQLGSQTCFQTNSDVGSRIRFSSDVMNRTYALRDRDWLVLAIQALLKNEFESCLRWIGQVDCRGSRPASASELPQQQQLIGDVNAVLACVASRFGRFEESERFLTIAYQSHLEAEAFGSVCRDLILTARLAALQGEAMRAKSLLDAAECQLIMAFSPFVADCSPLAAVIHGTRYLDSIVGDCVA